jgi:5-methylcytosine-specific restriction endonuclease McrA
METFSVNLFKFGEPLTGNADGNPEPRLTREEWMRLNKYTEDQLRNAIKNSISIAEALKKLKVKPCGGNYAVFKKAIMHFTIDTSHFVGQGWNKNKTVPPKRSINDYLTNKISITSYKLCQRLLKDKIKRLQCERCGNIYWNNKPIPLELHHINGNNKDNRLENIQLLCPNCHALTDNYRNRK